MDLQSILSDEGLVTIKVAAQAVGKSTNTVRRWITEQRLEVFRPVAGAARYVKLADAQTVSERKRGWPVGVARCPACRGKLVIGHVCPIDKGLVTIKVAAQAVGKSEGIVRRWIRDRLLRAVQPVAGAAWHVRLVDAQRVKLEDEETLSRKRGWPAGVPQCPVCHGKLVTGHVCPDD